MLTVVAWSWGGLFPPVYVHRLRAALARHLTVPHELVCITDAATGVDADRVVPMPHRFSMTPRCRRRMQIFAREFGESLGATRILAIDLDVVITGDLTSVVTRSPPVVGYRVGHAGVYSGSFLVFDVGALDGAWRRFEADPEGWPASLQPRGVASDQAMVNAWLQETGTAVDTVTEADGFLTYYGRGYERLEHWGVGPTRPELPAGTRIVILGSADKAVMDEARFPWMVEHWGPALSPVRKVRAS